MTTYYIRTVDPDTMLALAVQIGVLRVTEQGEHVIADPHAGLWDVVGPIHRPTGNVISTEFGDVPETAPITDAEGRVYWHANLMLYSTDLLELAQAAYAADPSPELGEALQSIPAYFVADAVGRATAPAQPARAFA